MKSDYRLISVDAATARFESTPRTTILPAPDVDAKVDVMSQSGKGTFELDRERGWLKSSRIGQKIELTLR
ncbi:MAG: hypothetical protein U0835_20960 [Isosphaeraceae bacterium]